MVERGARWRRIHALREFARWLLAPTAFFIRPHLPWVFLVIALGAVRGWGRFREHRTLRWLHGACPKCGTEQDFTELGRMLDPHMVRCANCRWSILAEVARGPVEP